MNVPDELRKTAAEALNRWQETRAVVCEHSQIIDYGDAAETVLAAVLPKVRADERANAAREVGETIDCDTLTDFDCGMAHAITIILGEVDPSPEELGLPPEIFNARGES